MYKLVTFSGYDPQTGPHIFPIEPDVDKTIGHIKMARSLPSSIEQYIRSAKPIPGKTQLLIDAMGSGEYYGSNVNGDYFPDVALSHDGNDYGYKTFMLYAYPYKHHVNKDPARAYGERVTLSAWDPHMHRVLLIVIVDDAKCRDILADLARGHYWDVSMGCFLGDTLVTMADGTRKAICNVRKGDLVLTHRGRIRRVTAIHRRPYKGELYTLQAEAHEPIRVTRQHPFLFVDAEDVKHIPKQSNRRWKIDIDLRPDWVHAECLDDQFLLEPIVTEELTPDYVQRDFARLFGYYLAEGHVLRGKGGELVGIEFSTHRDDAIHDEIDELCNGFGTRNAPVTSNRSRTEFSRSIIVFDKRLAELCYQHGGGYAKSKRLSSEAIRWAPEMQREIVGAYANGDGTGPDDGSLKLSTASTYLAWQWMIVLPRIGAVASISNLKHKAGTGFSRRATYEWVIHLGKQYAQPLRPFCKKVVPAEILKAKQSRKLARSSHLATTYLITPIRELDSIYAETEVFNLEIEDDESYIAGGLAVHNCRVPWDECSICKNRAKNRAQYCMHLRYQMNKILQDGRRVFAFNWLPKFFDISFVTIGAEKASHVLRKVAHLYSNASPLSSAELGEQYYAKLSAAEKAAIQKKRAEIDKDVPSQPPANVQGATPEDKEKLKSFMGDAGAVKSTEQPLPTATLDALAQFPLREVFSTLGALGIDLRPQEFQRIILVKQGAGKLAHALDRHRLVFDEYQPSASPPGWAQEFKRFDPTAISEKVAMILRPFLRARSCYPEILHARLEQMEKVGIAYNPESQWYPMSDEQKRQASGMHGLIPASVALAAGFLVFRRAFPGLVMKGPAPIRALAKHPWLLPLLIGAGVGASVGLQVMHEPMPLKSYGTGTGLDGKMASAYHEAKTASLRVGDISLAYVHAGTQPQWRRKEQTDWFERLAFACPELLVKHGGSYPGANLEPEIMRTVTHLAAIKETTHGHAR